MVMAGWITSTRGVQDHEQTRKLIHYIKFPIEDIGHHATLMDWQVA